MFCTKCGAQIPDGSQFCTKCGAPTIANKAAAQQPLPTHPAPVAPSPQEYCSSEQYNLKPKRSKTPLIIAIIVVVTAAIVGAILFLIPNAPFAISSGQSSSDSTSRDSRESSSESNSSSRSSQAASSTSADSASNGSSSSASSSSGSSSSSSSSSASSKATSYSYTISVPSSFTESATETGTTREFTHNNSDMTITCETHANANHQSVESRMAEVKAGATVAYEATGSNWYVLSWARGTTVYYLKEYVTNDQFNSVLFVYTKSDAADKLLEEIVPTFKLQ